MFISKHLNRINMYQLINDYKHDSFYLNHHFILLKKHVNLLNNYENAQERRKDYLNVIDLGLDMEDIYATEDAIRFFIYKIKDEVYSIDRDELFDLAVSLFFILNKYKNYITECEKENGKKDEKIIIKKYFIKELEEIHEIINNRINHQEEGEE